LPIQPTIQYQIKKHLHTQWQISETAIS